MVGRFQNIILDHKDVEYVVDASKVMGLIDTVEEHITLGEIVQDQSARKTLRFGKLSQAYAAALRYAGAKVTDEEIYLSLLPQGKGPEDADAMRRRSVEIVTALLQLMIPPDEATKGKDLGDQGNE